MRSKITYIIAAILQIAILFYLINAESSVLKSTERFVSGTKMVELQRFTESQTIHLTFPMNSLSSMNCAFDEQGFQKNHPVYVKLQKKDQGVTPVFFGVEKPELNANDILLKGKVAAVDAEKLFVIKYEAKGKVYETRWMDKKSYKKGEAVMLALDPANPANIEFVSDWKEYQTHTPGTISRIEPIVKGNQPANLLTIEFERDGRKITDQYTIFTEASSQPVVLGAAVEVSFKPETNKILFVNFNPLVKGEIAEVKTGYLVEANYGIESFNLLPEQKVRLNELIDQHGDAHVSVEFAVNPAGNAALTGIFIGGQKLELN